jgi:hypothetical protein
MRWIKHNTNELARVGVLSGLHFAVSYVSQIASFALYGVLGPFSVFITGVADEGFTCLLRAVTVALVPRFGTLTLSSLTVFALNCIFSGQFALASLALVLASVTLGEGVLAIAGVTTGGWIHRPRAAPTAALVAVVAAAIGVTDAVKYYVQFYLVRVLYEQRYDDWYVDAVVLVTALGYGTLGAAAGVVLSVRLRSALR